VLYGQTMFQNFYEVEPKYTLEGKKYVQIRYGTVTEDTFVLDVYNWSDKDYYLDYSYELYEVNGDEEKLIAAVDNGKELFDRKTFTYYAVKLPDGIRFEEGKQYLLKYGRNETGYIYNELLFEK